MMGERRVGQDSLFYSFSLESHVLDGHLLRVIDKLADLSFVREHLKGYYSHTGRPSIDPELMTVYYLSVIVTASGLNGAYAKKFISI